ncbi:ABC transporter ATP-binding protein [Lujinxingia vulgaris]|uniref:ABC transporter ATP-binding protein n=1 Tax=Lujinxingia vulgaris TaxID=2600176 RepID=UPI001E3AAEDD|nr:ABC transporter ATP-binding protein [Lujinxingia vulgaris]
MSTDPAAASTIPESSPDDTIVRVRGLHKKYGDFTAVDHIDLDVPRGEVFGVLGPNGAGKTTTLRMITGLIAPDRGDVVIDGHDLGREPVNARRVTGFIPDRPYVYDKLTTLEYLRFIGGLYKMKANHVADRIDELLTLFGLKEWADSLIESFSHGMKQRLVFCGALLPEPSVLVVDEPMVGLDPRGHRLIKSLFRELVADKKMSILLSTHTLEVAEEVCDRIVIINHGRIVARGSLGELRLESGQTDGNLEQVFLRITEESQAERDQAVAERFGHEPGERS